MLQQIGIPTVANICLEEAGSCVVMAYIVMTYIVMAYIVMAYIVVAYVVMAYIVMAYIVIAVLSPPPVASMRPVAPSLPRPACTDMCVDMCINMCTDVHLGMCVKKKPSIQTLAMTI